MRRTRLRSKKVVAGLVACGLCAATGSMAAGSGQAVASPTTKTPIQHVVVIFGENISFDHYFGTYRPSTHGPRGAQKLNGLYNTPGSGGVGTLLNNNPNKDLVNTTQADNPRQLDPTNVNDILTCDQDHGYTDEQTAFDAGKMDNFPSVAALYNKVGQVGAGKDPSGQLCSPADVMNYYAGDTVTGMWSYADHFALNDNSFGTTFGPSAPGAINLASGLTDGVINPINNATAYTASNTGGDFVPNGIGGNTLISDAQPYWDDCSTRDAVGMSSQNIGDLLNTAGLSWGWFQGGFRPTTSFATASGNQPTATFTPEQFASFGASHAPANITAKGPLPATALPPGAGAQGICNAVHPIGPAIGGIGGTAGGGTGQYGWKDDYIDHHEPFQYYQSTANPHHLPPASLGAIGTDTQTVTAGVPQFDKANHQYDTLDFDSLVGGITRGTVPPSGLPAVSFLKAPGFQDAHAQYSDPLDEQAFVVKEINALEHTPDWSSTAVILAYDDSDGWYDHVFAGTPGTPGGTKPIVANPSQTAADDLNNPAVAGSGCGSGDPKWVAPSASGGVGPQGRCAYGPRLPLLVISPYAKRGYVDHTLTDQSSIIHFIEYNWDLPFIPNIGPGNQQIHESADKYSGVLTNMFDFDRPDAAPLFLDPISGREAATATEVTEEPKKG